MTKIPAAVHTDNNRDETGDVADVMHIKYLIYTDLFA